MDWSRWSFAIHPSKHITHETSKLSSDFFGFLRNFPNGSNHRVPQPTELGAAFRSVGSRRSNTCPPFGPRGRHSWVEWMKHPGVLSENVPGEKSAALKTANFAHPILELALLCCCFFPCPSLLRLLVSLHSGKVLRHNRWPSGTNFWLLHQAPLQKAVLNPYIPYGLAKPSYRVFQIEILVLLFSRLQFQVPCCMDLFYINLSTISPGDM